MMVPFPRPSELTAASALLLLNATTPPPRVLSVVVVDDELSSVREPSKRDDESFVSCDSNSCASSLRLLSKEEIRARQIKIVSLQSLHRDVKLKAAQKSESKIPKGVVKFNCRKTSYGVKVATTTSFASTSSVSSCLTTSSTVAAASSARSKHASNAVSWKKPGTVAENQREQIPNKKMKKTKKQLGSNKMRRKAQAILELLSRGCYSEVAIRQTLGDSPDTSKALRMLLRLDEVKRFGAGGRHSPFIYTIA